MRMRSLAGFTFILMASVAGVAADEWRVEKLHGLVFVHHEAQWHPLEIGDIVSDERVIRTLPSGRVQFVRDEERIELDGDSQIQIKDAERSRFTTVEQWYGEVTIEAEKQNVQHFAVQTPYLAAVVKGTRFTVTFEDGQSRVTVEEGTVQVHDELYDVVTDVRAGQRADVAPGNMLEVSGPGSKAAVIAIETGEIITKAVRESVEDGDVLPGEVGEAVANVAAGLDPGNGLGSDNANRNANGNTNSGNGHGNQGNSGNSSNGGGNGNSGNGNGVGLNLGNSSGKGVGLSVGVGNGDSGNGGGVGVGVGVGTGDGGGNGNSGDGGGIGVSVGVGGGTGSGNSGSSGGIGVDVNVGGGGVSLNIGGGGHGNDDDGGLIDVDVDLGGVVGGLLGG